MLLITSLSPSIEKIPQQRAAIESWIRAGFEVISFNHESDIHEIRKHEVYDKYNLYFELSDTPLVRVRDIFEKFNNTEFCFANADIEFIDHDFYWGKIKKYIESHSSLLYLCRYNYQTNKKNSEMEKFGIDTFFIPKNFYTMVAECIPEYLFIGRPLWDYFIPFISVQNTIRIDLFYSHEELTYHKNHQKRWNSQEWVEIANKLRAQFPPLQVERLRQFSPNMRGIFISRANMFDL